MIYHYLIVKQYIRYVCTAICSVESTINQVTITREYAALFSHLIQVYPALITKPQGGPYTQPQGGTTSISSECLPGKY